ncbi:MAG: lysophospholipid acyltransferase family protein [Anaerolineales bacterium]|nr:lysophospholipid acyltransferase family protein [Anaerolineales bacterium]
MDLQAILNSQTAGKLAFHLSRRLPPKFGSWIAGVIARWIAAQRETLLVQAIRGNQWVVSGRISSGALLSAEQLDRAAQETLTYLALAFYQLFRNFESAEALQQLVCFTPQVEEVIARSREGRHGVLVAGLHMAGFDLVAQAAALRGFRGVALSLPQTSQAVEWQHAFRRRSGLEILPANVANLRQAARRLSQGETILTGIDRPMPGLKYRPLFFDRPALLPTHHVYLALKAGAPVIVMGAMLKPDGRYHFLSSDYIQLRPYEDRAQEMVCNAERLLEAAEEIIRQAPRQWAVPHPVWPEVFSENPLLLGGKNAM